MNSLASGAEEMATMDRSMAHVIRSDFGETRLDALQRHAFRYFLNETNPANGLVADRTQPGAPASIAAVGFALAAYPVGVERGWMTTHRRDRANPGAVAVLLDQPARHSARHDWVQRVLLPLPRHDDRKRVGLSELSTVDTSFLLAGMLAAAAYFDEDSEAEREIRTLADALYRRADWPWACDGGATVTHGWTPESGFLPYRWEGYDEAMLLYALGLGSPTYPLPTESYAAWTSSYQWKNIDGYELLYGGPLFIHQYSHVFVDFRGSRMRSRERRASTTARTAAARPTSSRRTRSGTLSTSRATGHTSGD
jgi:hypothetical protein